jgi:2-alkyl-3-oxoalkanoate reductase
MRIFITGATGVIGRRVVPRLIEEGHDVTAVARSAEKRGALARLGATAVDANLFASHTLLSLLAGHDAVINLATHIPSSSTRMLLPGAWRENDRRRSEAAPNLAGAASRAGVPRFIQESFAPVYPDRGNAAIDESTPIAPVRINRSVADAEQAALRFEERGGIGIVLRFAAFYGPDSKFMHELAVLLRHGFAPLFGPPEAFISSVSHDDAATAVIKALELPSGTYNVCDDQPVSHRAFAEALAEAIGADTPHLPPPWMTPMMGSIGKMMARSERISNAKLREFGWAPRYRSVHEGFPAIAAALGAAGVHRHEPTVVRR